jgi:hypothetical protein
MAKSRKFHLALFLSAHRFNRERHCLFVITRIEKKPLCISFLRMDIYASIVVVVCCLDTVNRLNIYSTPVRDLVRLLFDSQKSNNKKKKKRVFLTGGLCHHLFACQTKLQNVYNRQSIISRGEGVYIFIFQQLSIIFCRSLVSWVARKEGAADVVTDHQVPVWTESQKTGRSRSFLFHKYRRERGRRLHSFVCGWPHFQLKKKKASTRSSVVIKK